MQSILFFNTGIRSTLTINSSPRESAREERQARARVVGEQASATVNRKLAARLRFARFPFRRTLADFDFQFQPTLDRKLVDDLATLRFIEENRPILFLGQPGCGKTHLAVALATTAVEAGYRGYFTTADDMVNWASSGLTDIHHQGHSPGKDVQNGDYGTEEAPSSSVVHPGVQG